MNRQLSFVFFIGIMMALTAGLHYYLWARLVRDPRWPAPWPKIGSIALIALGMSIPGFMFLRFFAGGGTPIAAFVAYGWMALALMLFMATVTLDAARGAARLGRRLLTRWRDAPSEPEDPERRLAIARTLTAAAATVAVVPSAAGVASALGDVETPEVKVKLDRLPPALTGLTIAQLTDIHIGPTLRHEWLKGIVDKTNAMKPDVVVITGDLVDGSVPELAYHVAPLMNLASRYGTYFVSGNHEFYSGLPEWMLALNRMGIRVLDNERVSIGDSGPGGASIDLAGIHDPSGERFNMAAPDIGKALEGRDPERELVLLAHQPKAIYDAAAHDVGLQLSGHTHGGQFFPITWITHLVHPYVAGLDLHDGSRTQIYVSRGTGFWGPPMRVGAPAEITKIILT